MITKGRTTATRTEPIATTPTMATMTGIRIALLKPHKHLSHSYPRIGAVWSVGARTCDGTRSKCPKYSVPVNQQAWQVAMDRMDRNTNAHVPTQVQTPAAPSPDSQSQVSSISQPMATNQANVPSEPQLPAWMGAHIPIPRQWPIATSLVHHLEELDLSRGLMLDSGTSASIACNRKHVHGIRLAKVPLPVGTNGGPITVSYQAAFNALPKLEGWLYDQGVANVICQADIEDHPNMIWTMTRSISPIPWHTFLLVDKLSSIVPHIYASICITLTNPRRRQRQCTNHHSSMWWHLQCHQLKSTQSKATPFRTPSDSNSMPLRHNS